MLMGSRGTSRSDREALSHLTVAQSMKWKIKVKWNCSLEASYNGFLPVREIRLERKLDESFLCPSCMELQIAEACLAEGSSMVINYSCRARSRGPLYPVGVAIR
jgi:uncharacterized ferredoxin-like protein